MLERALLSQRKPRLQKSSFLDFRLLLFQNQYGWIPMNPTHKC